MSEFLSMGGYAVYVWSAYGLVALGVAVLVGFALKRRADANALLARVQLMERAEAEPDRAGQP